MVKKKKNIEQPQKVNVFRETFSASSGHLSSKRILGGIVLMACLIFCIVQGAREGMTDNIKDLFEILIITSTALLGITSVTSIWKGRVATKNEQYE
jgi:hypothetical protein